MSGDPINVLLIEDDEDDYALTRSLLSEIDGEKFDLEWVKDYQSAINKISKNQHDVYVVDYRLGVYSGLDLLTYCMEHGCAAPVILLTGQGDHDLDVAAMRAGAADYLVKGQIDAPLLERSIRYAIERHRTLAALRQALQERSLLELAIANITTGVIITDANQPDNPVIFINPAFETITGYTTSEVVGRNCRFLQGDATDRETIAAIREAIAARRPISCTLLNYRKDGSSYWNQLSINPVFNAAGILTHFVGLQNDVSDRKRAEQALEQLRHRNELILNFAGEGIYGLDLMGNAVFVNPAASRMLGWAGEDLLGKPIDAILHHSDRDRPHPQEACLIHPDFRDGEVHHVDCEIFWRKDGTSFPVEYVSTPIWEHEQMVGTVVVFQDITDRKRAEEALRDSEERYALAVRGANDGIWDWNLRTGEVYFSPRWKAMLGYAEDEIEDSLDEWFDRVHPDDLYWLKRELTAHLEGMTPHFEHEHRMRHRNGDYYWMLSRGLAVQDDGKATRMAGSQTDITGRKHVEEQLLHDAFHDVLTGLPNRALLMDRLRHTVEVAKRNSTYLFAVLFLDIDRFKVINDSLGHMMGDQLLVAIAQRLTSCIRPGDTIARLGGDEFVVLLENIKDLNSAIAVADRIQQELAIPINLGGQDIFTTASIGIAVGAGDYEWAEDLLRDADTAMYRAKATGRARHEIFNTGMHLRAVALLQIENDLRRAIERGEFQLHYQPIVTMRDLKVTSFEALLRWQHPDRGMISPAEFIPVAEETGLIVSIGKWVLQEACRQMQDWHTRFPSDCSLAINVNLSSKQFTAHLIDQVAEILQETHLAPHQLKLEITESVLMENAESAVAILTQLKKFGIQLSIDDFGTGYSSLSYLHRFPIDTLKIDRSFINKLDHDGEQLAIVRTIMTLAWNLGIDVVAEGVESPKQIAQLRSLQCEFAQGYYFSQPLPADAAERLISSEPPWREPTRFMSL